MELDIDRELVLSDVENMDDAKQRLKNVLGTAPEEKISNIGVPYSKYRIADDPQGCLWISPNQVAAGHSGDSPRSFEFTGSALRFPELADDAVIFECPVSRLEPYRDLMLTHGIGLVTIEQAANEGR